MSHKTLNIHHKNQLDNALWETMTVYCENLHCGIKLETMNVQTTGTHSNHQALQSFYIPPTLTLKSVHCTHNAGYNSQN